MAKQLSKRYLVQDMLERYSRHVYFQPPSGHMLQYPCIVYQRVGRKDLHAEDDIYVNYMEYSVTVIDTDPDSTIADEMVEDIRYCSFDRSFVQDGLNHTNLTLYK